LAGKLLNSAEKLNYHADKNPLKKVGNPEDVANAASFLLGEKSSWITGQIIHVDGGYSTINQ
jgi:enoyl-[acyl-carrier-protein] reductase (NADH)